MLRLRPEASGVALPLDKAIRLEFLRKLGPCLLVPIFCFAFVIAEPESWIQAVFSAVMLLAFGLPWWFAGLWGWREKLRTVWSAMLPKAGTRIAADAGHLTIGETAVPWNDVRLEGVEVRDLFFTTRWWWRFSVDQLRLITSKGHYALDRRLIENGQEIIDTICSRLI